MPTFNVNRNAPSAAPQPPLDASPANSQRIRQFGIGVLIVFALLFIGGLVPHLFRNRAAREDALASENLVPLVEVTQNEFTSDATVQKTIALLRDAGRRPVHVKKDIPGFVGNRLQHALKREAIALVAAGVCDADTIDEVVKSGFGARMAVLGPMEQTDLVGVDLTLDIQNTVMADLDRSTEPTQFIKDKVAQGKLGMRTGEGFRKWTPQSADAVRERLRNFLAAQAKART